MIQWNAIVQSALASVLFSLVGLLFFGLAFVLVTKVVPFSVRKELETDHNTALAIVIGAVLLGLAMIVSAAIG